MSIPHGETDAAAASGFSKGQRRKHNKRTGFGRSTGNWGRSVIMVSPTEYPVPLALDSILGYLGDTLKSWGILPLSFRAPRMHFLSAMVTFVGRGIPLPHPRHGKDVGGIYLNPAPQCQSGRAELEYFPNCNCTAQPLVE